MTSWRRYRGFRGIRSPVPGGRATSTAVSVATGHRPAGTVPGDEAYLVSMMYDEFGQRVSMKLGNGVVSAYAYDPLTRRLASLTTTTPLGRTLQNISYSYDRVGNVKAMVNALGEPVRDQSGTVSFQYGYDDLYRLTSAYGEAKSRVHTIDTASYAYSDIHNMTSNVQIHEIVHGGATLETERPPKTNHDFAYSYDPAHPHQATQIGDTFVTYDGNGNTVRECRTQQGDPSCQSTADHLRMYSWSADNRLEHVIEGGGWNITRFLYDAGGDRVVKLGRGGEAITIGQFWSLKGRRAATKHVFAGATRLASKLLPPPGWDQTSQTAVVLASLTTTALSTSGTTTTLTSASNDSGCDPSNYQPTKCPVLPGGDPSINHAFDDTRVRPETYYYHQDHLGSTSWVTDQNARVHEHVEYFPYGEVWRDPPSDRDGAPVKGQRFLFTSKEMDEETGLYYFGARYLNPVRARWLSIDPLLNAYRPTTVAYNPAQLAVYSYGRQNPIVYIDPDGNLAAHHHFLITFRAARDSGFSFWQSLKLAWRTMMADSGSTPLGAPSQGATPASTVQHAMAGRFPGSDKPQSREEATAAAKDFIEHYQTSEKYVPNALHVAEDLETPRHEGSPWPPTKENGETDNSAVAHHIWEDIFPSKETKKNAYEAARKVLDAYRASKDKQKDPGQFNIERPEYGYKPPPEKSE